MHYGLLDCRKVDSIDGCCRKIMMCRGLSLSGFGVALGFVFFARQEFLILKQNVHSSERLFLFPSFLQSLSE
jgi:hypothetical protein